MTHSTRSLRPRAQTAAADDAQRSLWEQPDRWAQLDNDQLQRLTMFACVHYGRTCDPRDLAHLMALYPLVAERLPLEIRQDLLVGVNELVEQGSTTVNAFLPFIHMDPELGVISSAALDFAVLMPLRDGDPLTGPKYLLRDVVGLPNDEHIRVGTLIGLLLLGDRRVTRLLDRCWLDLSPAGRNQLSHAYSGWTYASTVEFLLNWLDDTLLRGDESEFGFVAAAIAKRAGATAAPDGPGCRAAVPGGRISRTGDPDPAEWTFEDYGAVIADRLTSAYRAESYPTVVDKVMEVWDIPVPTRLPLDLGSVADALRSGASDVQLSEPPTEPGLVTILAWGYFNPFGPTANRIDALLLPEADELLVVSVSDHPAYPDCRAIAVVPPGGDRAAAVRAVLGPIFAANGDGETWSLIGSVPSYVHLFPESPVDHACAAELFRVGNAAGAAMSGMLTDYRESIEDVLRSWQDPWGHAAEAVTRAFTGADAQRLLARIRRLEVGEWFDDEDEDGEPEHGDSIETDDLFDLWYALATQPAYAARIERQMEAARVGAQAFQAGAFL
jgi:hypothetical protein